MAERMNAGYDGDLSQSEESDENGGMDVDVGFIVEIKPCTTSKTIQPRKRLKRRAPGVAPSPIHPDIDISLCANVSSNDLLGNQKSHSMLSHLPTGPQLISDITTLERVASTTFSKHYRSLEDGLALTEEPRLLIEAACPHRVVHANASFTQSVIGTSSNVQRWIQKQNSDKIPPNRNIQRALRDIVPDTEIHLIVYPVLGQKSISHFLVETADDSSRIRKKRHRRGKMDDATRAVG